MRIFVIGHRRFPLFHETPTDGGAGGGGGAPSPSPAPAAPAPAASPAAPAPGSGAGPAAAPSPTPAAPSFTYGEDRSTWIPPHRLNEVTTRYRQEAEARRDLERRYRALAGLEQPRNTEHDAVRAQFSTVFPELAPLLQHPDQLQRVLALVQSGQLNEIAGTTQAYWARHAQQVSRDLVTRYAASVGVEPSTLGPRATNRMALQLKAFIEEDQTGDRQYRFEMGDPSLVEECLADMQGMFVEPVRRSTATAAARTVEQNRRLPEAGARGAVPPAAAAPAGPIDRKARREAARQFVLANR